MCKSGIWLRGPFRFLSYNAAEKRFSFFFGTQTRIMLDHFFGAMHHDEWAKKYVRIPT